MINFDKNNNLHKRWMVILTLIYYANGDVKDIYEYESSWGTYGDFKEAFGLKDDDETAVWLSKYDHIYSDDDYLTLGLPDDLEIEPSKKPSPVGYNYAANPVQEKILNYILDNEPDLEDLRQNDDRIFYGLGNPDDVYDAANYIAALRKAEEVIRQTYLESGDTEAEEFDKYVEGAMNDWQGFEEP